MVANMLRKLIPICPSAAVRSVVLPEDLDRVFATIEVAAGDFYPGFRSWYYDKVVTGIELGDRAVFIVGSENAVLGAAIAKRSADERKLCTLWVENNARGDGIAGALVDTAFDWLGTSSPLFTIPEERMTEFRGLLNRWRCSITQREMGIYRPDKIEFVFNGQLRSALSL
jgi:hypothetical protein